MPALSRSPIAAFAIACVALASAPHAEAEDCSGATDQAALNQCADTAYRAADAALNERYRQIVARLEDNPDAHKLLVAAQRAWIDFRDRECAFAASGVAGGSIYPMIVSDCLTTLTEARSAQLANYLDCEEGDLGCPIQ